MVREKLLEFIVTQFLSREELLDLKGDLQTQGEDELLGELEALQTKTWYCNCPDCDEPQSAGHGPEGGVSSTGLCYACEHDGCSIEASRCTSAEK